MSQQVGSNRPGDWERQQTQQFRQEQCGYLDLPFVPSKKNKNSLLKESEQAQATVKKVWHEGAD